GCRPHSFFHGPRVGGPFTRRDARPAAVPYLRTLRHRTALADGTRVPIVRHLRAPRIENSRLVAARVRSTKPVLRRSHWRSALRAGRAHPERARSPLLRSTLFQRLPVSNRAATEWKRAPDQKSRHHYVMATVFAFAAP